MRDTVSSPLPGSTQQSSKKKDFVVKPFSEVMAAKRKGKDQATTSSASSLKLPTSVEAKQNVAETGVPSNQSKVVSVTKKLVKTTKKIVKSTPQVKGASSAPKSTGVNGTADKAMIGSTLLETSKSVTRLASPTKSQVPSRGVKRAGALVDQDDKVDDVAISAKKSRADEDDLLSSVTTPTPTEPSPSVSRERKDSTSEWLAELESDDIDSGMIGDDAFDAAQAKLAAASNQTAPVDDDEELSDLEDLLAD
mmetsp:Transcript_92216/g.128025  ORF Transcript_92216/g.128025 Transcript_92216/m.128025 type:complete len:251 (+) Transcript_92216:1158-1910(+)